MPKLRVRLIYENNYYFFSVSKKSAIHFLSEICRRLPAVYTVTTTLSRAVTGLLTGHNTLRRHLYLPELLDCPMCRRCGVGEDTSARILCECEALASLRRAYLGSFFLEPEDIKEFKLGGHLELQQSYGAPMIRYGAQKARLLRPRCIWAERPRTQMLRCAALPPYVRH